MMNNKKQSVLRNAGALLLALATGTSLAETPPAPEQKEWSTTRLSREICGTDDWQGFNRAMFGIENAVVEYLGEPVSWVYCSIVPKPLVKGIDNAVDNSEYPIRFFSTLFRAEWSAAWDETCRFVVNSTVGLGGLFDPAKNWCDIYTTDASLSGTFATWGIPRGNSLILPFVPRANVRDDVGYICDQALDPKTYVDLFFPTGIGLGWTASLWPNYAAVWIDLWNEEIVPPSDSYAKFRQLISAKSLLDEDLSIYRYAKDSAAGTAESRRPPVRAALEKPAGLQGRWRDLADYNPRTPALDTLRVRLFHPVRDDDFWWTSHSIFNHDFARDVDEREVQIATNLPPAHYGFVPAPENAAPDRARRLVFIIPGITGTHKAKATLAMAEIVNNAGAAAVLCDDPFHWQYMMSANHGLLPGNMPEDAKRYAAFIRAVLADLRAEGLVDDPEVSIVGWSMGGLLTAHLAALEQREGLGFHTGPLLAVNPPVALDSIDQAINSFLAPSRAWTAEEAKTNFVEITRRLLVWSQQGKDKAPDISEADAQYTTALVFGSILPELVSCTTHVDEDVSIRDYFSRHVLAQYPKADVASLAREVGLRGLEKELRGHARLRMIHTCDDFLLTADDRAYLDRTLGDRLTWFAAGAHCGMFYTPEFKDEVLRRLDLAAD